MVAAQNMVQTLLGTDNSTKGEKVEVEFNWFHCSRQAQSSTAKVFGKKIKIQFESLVCWSSDLAVVPLNKAISSVSVYWRCPKKRR